MKSNVRRGVQVFFFLWILISVTGHALEEAGVVIPLIGGVSIHGICPFGSVVSIYQMITTGTMVKKVHEAANVVFGLVLISAVFFGPVFCSWMCPLGTVQEWISDIGKRLKVFGKIKVPNKVHNLLKYGRYAVLLWILFVTARSGDIIFQSYDPYYALFNFYTGEVAISALIILVAVLITSLFLERPWCKYACPFGAVLGVTNKFRIFTIKRNSQTCIDCKVCDTACPMGIEVSNVNKVSDTLCNSCLTCTSDNICPVNDTVKIDLRMGGNDEN